MYIYKFFEVFFASSFACLPYYAIWMCGFQFMHTMCSCVDYTHIHNNHTKTTTTATMMMKIHIYIHSYTNAAASSSTVEKCAHRKSWISQDISVVLRLFPCVRACLSICQTVSNQKHCNGIRATCVRSCVHAEIHTELVRVAFTRRVYHIACIHTLFMFLFAADQQRVYSMCVYRCYCIHNSAPSYTVGISLTISIRLCLARSWFLLSSA